MPWDGTARYPRRRHRDRTAHKKNISFRAVSKLAGKKKKVSYLATGPYHGVALLDELVDVAAGQGALQKHHDVLDHVLVRDVLQEGGQGLLCLCLQVVELDDL